MAEVASVSLQDENQSRTISLLSHLTRISVLLEGLK